MRQSSASRHNPGATNPRQLCIGSTYDISPSFLFARASVGRRPVGACRPQLLAMIAEFERARIHERVIAGLAPAKAQGRKLGSPEREIPVEQIDAVRELRVREAARRLGIPRTTLQAALARIPLESTL